MLAEITFIRIITNFLFREDLISLENSDIKQIDHLFVITDQMIRQEYKYCDQPNTHIYRHDLIVRLFEEYGLSESIKRIDLLLSKIDILLQSDKVTSGHIGLAKAVLETVKVKIEEYYDLLLLEKMAGLLIVVSAGKHHLISSEWLFNDDRGEDLINYKKDQYMIDKEDERLFVDRMYHRRQNKKKRTYKELRSYMSAEEVETYSIEALKLISDHLFEKVTPENKKDLMYFGEKTYNVLKAMPKEYTKYVKYLELDDLFENAGQMRLY